MNILDQCRKIAKELGGDTSVILQVRYMFDKSGERVPLPDNYTQLVIVHGGQQFVFQVEDGWWEDGGMYWKDGEMYVTLMEAKQERDE